jgi:gamma-glutamyl:cysteine ligase YbdK (ATP-grasp superfamily)
MNLFEPRSFSTDWEIMVIDRLERCVSHGKITAFSGALSREFDLPINVDWNTLELALGVNTSFPAFWERVRTVTDRAGQLVGEFDLDLFPSGGHPVERIFNAAHIHVGTVQDETTAIHLENQMIAYAPCFAALAANSPLSNGRRGEFKSYRVRHNAHGDTRPMSVRDPRLYQVVWGGDAGPKLFGAPTVEVRIIDCASSRRLLAELVTFVAAYVHYRGTRVEERSPTPREYQDAFTNRWSAARHGLQATFLWNGAARPVVEILDEMLDECAEALAVLGARRPDLGLIESMLKKRLCQADYALELAGRYPDPYQLASAFAKLARHWDVFDTWIAEQPAREPVPAPDEEAILAEHLANIGEGTHFYHSRRIMSYPPPTADALIGRLVERGAIRREVNGRGGVVLSRVPGQDR